MKWYLPDSSNGVSYGKNRLDERTYSFVANEIPEHADTLDPVKLRPKVEPWLTALFQS